MMSNKFFQALLFGSESNREEKSSKFTLQAAFNKLRELSSQHEFSFHLKLGYIVRAGLGETADLRLRFGAEIVTSSESDSSSKMRGSEAALKSSFCKATPLTGVEVEKKTSSRVAFLKVVDFTSGNLKRTKPGRE
jgi:hypothetical protein